MRYRLMASYLGASYQAAVGPSDRDVTLFAAPPPPEEHGFSPAPGGIWRKQVRLDDLDGLWESRPIGSYHGEPCLVLDDLGDRLHIVYLGMDERRAAQLGYWEVDRGVFEVVVPRLDITDLAEERHEFPIALLLSALPALPRALGAGGANAGGPSALPAGRSGAGDGRVTGGTGPGGPGGASPAAAGAGPAMAGQAPGGMPGWNGQAGPQGPALGQFAPGGQAQLPPAMPQQPAAASLQQPVTGAYNAPQGQNGPGLTAPGRPGVPGLPNAFGAPGAPQRADMLQFPAGQQGPAGRQLPAIAPATPGTQPQGPGAAPLPNPAMQVSGRPQLPAAQLPAAQPSAAQPSAAQAPAAQAPVVQPQAPQPGVAPQQFSGLSSITAAPQANGIQQFAPAQQAAAQQAPGQQAPGQPGAGHPGAGQPGTAQLLAGQPATGPQLTNAQAPGGQAAGAQAAQAQAAQAQAAQAQAPQAAAPTAMAAWHGSPAPDGNGNWYYQPGPDPQQNGMTSGGYPVNGMPVNGYAQPDQGAGPPAPLNGLAGVPQYAHTAPQAPVAGYQQAPALPAPAQQPQQPQPGQPGQFTQPTQLSQPVQPGQPTQLGQQSQAGPGPALIQPPAPPAAAPAPSGPLPAAPVTAPLATPQPAVIQPPGAAEPAAPPPAVQRAVTQPLPPAPTVPSTGTPTGAPPVAPPGGGATGPLASLPPTSPADQGGSHSGLTTVGALGKLTGAVRGRRAARKPRLAMSAIFADLVDMADIPRSAYAVDEEITGAMCLFKTDGGYEVFSCAEDARHEVRFFEEEEAAYFYLFGVLAAEALRNGRLNPRRG